MKPVLNASQIREADNYTIHHEPISSIDLMERASRAFVKKFTALAERGNRIIVFCGTGNNGGDGLAISRLLREQAYDVSVYIIGNPKKGSPDFTTNLDRLAALTTINTIENEADIPQINETHITIDALFGSGLSRKIEGIFATVVQHLNQSGSAIYSVDIASGLFADQPSDGDIIIEPTHTISFQVPKPVFYMPSLSRYVGYWHIVDIGLDQGFVQSLTTFQFNSEREDFSTLLPDRPVYMHKGDAGRIQVIAGSKGKMGAAVLCTRAAIKSGAGLVFVQPPDCGRDILQISVPEAMVIDGKGMDVIEKISLMDSIDALAIGPGIGTNASTVSSLEMLLSEINCAMVLDADAINILSGHPHLINQLPEGCILTPHPGEFERLVGKWKNDFEKTDRLKEFCTKHQVNVVLKGAYSAVCNSDGIVFYNCSGNPGMATGGSGDVLTGIIVALLGQKLDIFNTLRLGVYLHGLAGDIGVRSLGQYGLTASDIIYHLPDAFQSLGD